MAFHHILGSRTTVQQRRLGMLLRGDSGGRTYTYFAQKMPKVKAWYACLVVRLVRMLVGLLSPTTKMRIEV